MNRSKLIPPVVLGALAVLGVVLIAGPVAGGPAPAPDGDDGDDLADRLRVRHGAAVDRIIAASLENDGAWAKLEYLCQDIGHRLSGSASLDRAIGWSVEAMKRDGHENVGAERVMVPKWVRGRESVAMVSPRWQPIRMLGLGGSVATPPEGITAPVVVVEDEEQLEALGEDGAKGKIVLFDNRMPAYDRETGSGYGQTVRFRVHGARLAAAKGAVASLVRSVTAHSLNTPHTGGMRYGDAERKIPHAAITTEGADLIHGLTKRGREVTLRLHMEARDDGFVPSANVVGELRGRERPDEVVVIGGHIDSWDVGQGAHDDGTGCVIPMEAITVLRRLGLRPRRTIRVVLWTNEENGLGGAREYARVHADELPKTVAAIESDSGGFAPRGFSVDMADDEKEALAAKQLAAIVSLLEDVGATESRAGFSGADVSPMTPHGVPTMGLWVEGDKYFDYHHTDADTLDKVDPDELRRCVATMAVGAYILAEMDGRLGEPTDGSSRIR